MGNREDLLAGAAQCLKEKGWARTTVRDIAAAAGVNHAAIGYHFGSRDALLTAAFVRAMDEWGQDLGAALAAALDPAVDDSGQYQELWRQMLTSFADTRKLWLASVEAFVQAEYDPALRELLLDAQRQGRRGLAAALLKVPEETVDESAARTVGAVQNALLVGMFTQWLMDPEGAPTAEEVLAGLRALGRLAGN
ncbi:TetR/AcrR family transcriptional regulator [Kitasatospora acidiphila]|uniref:TetR/AcrR family transcriptional regulator n=1 Tax=Kitasatospora acidiphila TaxID=2567942 RepID=A0A540W4Y6_9ACTN|nr:TetR/AcrR family transcriptional regulator [Kitasatospora acidiphila]TQF04099.1 TetR/AcrR family transcriptional regulator [Kitasatospora acidiphila]